MCFNHIENHEFEAPLLEAANISVQGDKGPLISNISLTLRKKGSLSIIGPSGSGKTTLLKALAGLVPICSGSLRMNGLNIEKTQPGQRSMGFVFQGFSLFPNMRVVDNVAFGLESRGISRCQRREIAMDSLKWAGLEHLAQRWPAALSGGESQRIALLRALAYEPEIILLDEPLSGVDTSSRGPLLELIMDLPVSRNIAVIFVGHDLDEAYATGENTLLLRNGQTEACSSREQMFKKPSTLFAARFMGFENILNMNALSQGQANGYAAFRPESALIETVHILSSETMEKNDSDPEIFCFEQFRKDNSLQVRATVTSISEGISRTRINLRVLEESVAVSLPCHLKTDLEPGADVIIRVPSIALSLFAQ